MKYMYNWFELVKKSNYEPESILILTYALTKSYNSIIAWNSKHLMNSLKIHKIPSNLLKRKLLIYSKKGIITRYVTKNPDAYFKNKKFLFLNIPLEYKIVYLYLLGHRKMSDNNDYLALNVFKDRITYDLDNPLLKQEKTNLKFIYEGE